MNISSNWNDLNFSHEALIRIKQLEREKKEILACLENHVEIIEESGMSAFWGREILKKYSKNEES